MFNKSSFYFFTAVIVAVLGLSRHLKEQIVSHEHCRYDRDCKDNAICVNNTVEQAGFCTCMPGYLLEKNWTFYECLKVANNLGDPCTRDDQCQVPFSTDSECRNRKCQCKMNAHFYQNQCWRTVGLDEICSFSEECWLRSGEPAFCVSGRCVCDFGQLAVKSPAGDECVQTVKLGQSCTLDHQCDLIPNSRCWGICQCETGYIPNYGQTECLELTHQMGGACKEDKQCNLLLNTSCRNNTCRCSADYHLIDNKCYYNVKLGGYCSATRECWTNSEMDKYVHCSEGVCKCMNGRLDDCGSCAVKIAGTYLFGASVLLSFFKTYL